MLANAVWKNVKTIDRFHLEKVGCMDVKSSTIYLLEGKLFGRKCYF